MTENRPGTIELRPSGHDHRKGILHLDIDRCATIGAEKVEVGLKAARPLSDNTVHIKIS